MNSVLSKLNASYVFFVSGNFSALQHCYCELGMNERNWGDSIKIIDYIESQKLQIDAKKWRLNFAMTKKMQKMALKALAHSDDFYRRFEFNENWFTAEEPVEYWLLSFRFNSLWRQPSRTCSFSIWVFFVHFRELLYQLWVEFKMCTT